MSSVNRLNTVSKGTKANLVKLVFIVVTVSAVIAYFYEQHDLDEPAYVVSQTGDLQSSEVQKREVNADGTCKLNEDDPNPGTIIESALITYDFNGNEYPNNYRVVVGRQLPLPCTVSYDRLQNKYGEPKFEEFLEVNVASNNWLEIDRSVSADSKYAIVWASAYSGPVPKYTFTLPYGIAGTFHSSADGGGYIYYDLVADKTVDVFSTELPVLLEDGEHAKLVARTEQSLTKTYILNLKTRTYTEEVI